MTFCGVEVAARVNGSANVDPHTGPRIKTVVRGIHEKIIGTLIPMSVLYRSTIMAKYIDQVYGPTTPTLNNLLKCHAFSQINSFSVWCYSKCATLAIWYMLVYHEAKT